MISELDIMARKSKKQTPEIAKFDTETAFYNYLQLPQICHLATRHRVRSELPVYSAPFY